MHKIIQFILGIFLLTFAQDTCAQTPYSSQNFNLNNFFNPATSGFGINNKVQTLFRTQYEGVGNAYRTIGIAADLALLRKLTRESVVQRTWSSINQELIGHYRDLIKLNISQGTELVA